MKLGTRRDGTRDGTLVVVSADLEHALPVPEIARTLQAALDDWEAVAPRLEQVYDSLQAGKRGDTEPFDPAAMMAPLPRAYQWCDGSAYLFHAELVRQARNAEMPQSLYSDPLIYQGGSDTMLGPRADIVAVDEAHGLDLEAEVAVITDDVPLGVSAEEARGHIKLVMIVNDVSLRNLIPHELGKQFGFFQSKPPTAFSGVAVTPDALGEHWDGAKLSLPILSHVNDRLIGRPNAGDDLNFDFGQLIAHATRTRGLGAGTIIGSGTVSNRDRAVGSSCLAECRVIETIDQGTATTPFLTVGDRVKIEVVDPAGNSIFGAIENRVVPHHGRQAA